MKDKLLQFCREQELIPPGSIVVCAVSGGADSMALLRCLLDLQEVLNCRVAAAHFNHHLRGAESDRDAQFVETYCRERDIPFYSGSGDVEAYASIHRCGTEEAARNLRYAYFATLPGILATAHTADDNAETVLMNLIRGTGLKGLCGIPVRRGNIIRPMLSVTRENVLTYLHTTQTPWREDSSNARDAYRRNRIRHHVIPLLKAENPALAQTLLSGSLRLQAEEDYLETETRNAIQTVRREGGWDCAALRSLPDAIRRRALLSLLRETGTADAHHVEKLYRLLDTDTPVGQVTLPQNRIAKKAYGMLRILPKLQTVLEEHLLPIPGTLTIPEIGMCVCTYFCENSEDFSENSETIFLNYDMISAPVTVRARRIGDSITLPGGSRSLKRLFIDRKIPQEQRDQIPVLVMGEQLLAVYQIGTNRKFVPQENSRVLAISFQSQKY